MVLRGYIDESYNDKIFTLSCLMSDSSDWMWWEKSWKLLLRSKNKSLKSLGRKQLSRYHAADCSSRVGEFEGWTPVEQIEFTKGMLQTFQRRFQNVIAYSISLADFKLEFPKHAEDAVESCYGLLLKFLMTEIVDQIESLKKIAALKPVKIALIHDRGRFDGTLLESFNSLMNDPTFSGQHYFTTIAPKGWEDCLPLQAADLLAYENFKESERNMNPRKRRKTLELLLANGTFGGRAKYIDRAALKLFREAIEESAK